MRPGRWGPWEVGDPGVSFSSTAWAVWPEISASVSLAFPRRSDQMVVCRDGEAGLCQVLGVGFWMIPGA